VSGLGGAVDAAEIELPATAAGTLTVSLTVTDDAGQRSTVQRSVAVSVAPQAEVPAPSGGGGGGAFSALWVALLALAVAVLLYGRSRGRASQRQAPDAREP